MPSSKTVHKPHTRCSGTAAALLAGLLVGGGLSAEAGAAGRERLQQVAAKAEPARPLPLSDGPLTLVVSIRDQKLTVYSGTEQIVRVPVSTGQRGHETPTGIFSVIQKARVHYSNLYDSVPMPFMQRLTWSGVAMHAGHLPGYPASHGCVRMPRDFAPRLYDMTRMGARVIIAQTDVVPVALDHPLLTALAPAEGASATPARAAHMLPGAPMRLGAIFDAGAAQGEATDVRPELPARSLLGKARQDITVRVTALAQARAAKAATAQRLADAKGTVREAREAHLRGRAEVAIAQASARRLAAETEMMAQRHATMLRTAGDHAGDAARMQVEDWLFLGLVQARHGVSAAQGEVSAKSEALQQIAGNLATAEAERLEVQRLHEASTPRLKHAEEALQQARRDLVKLERPVSLFASRKTGKLYVRQGFEPLFDAPVAFDTPDVPVGTHVFTVLAMKEAGEPVRWSAVTVPDAASGFGPPTAAAALDRLQLSAEVKEKLDGLIRTGSSLIISDQPLSRETGKATDLIVETR